MRDDEKCSNCEAYDPRELRCRRFPAVFTFYSVDRSDGRVHGSWEQPFMPSEGQCVEWSPRHDGLPPYPPADIPPQRVADRVRNRPLADVMGDSAEEEAR